MRKKSTTSSCIDKICENNRGAITKEFKQMNYEKKIELVHFFLDVSQNKTASCHFPNNIEIRTLFTCFVISTIVII